MPWLHLHRSLWCPDETDVVWERAASRNSRNHTLSLKDLLKSYSLALQEVRKHFIISTITSSTYRNVELFNVTDSYRAWCFNDKSVVSNGVDGVSPRLLHPFLSERSERELLGDLSSAWKALSWGTTHFSLSLFLFNVNIKVRAWSNSQYSQRKESCWFNFTWIVCCKTHLSPPAFAKEQIEWQWIVWCGGLLLKYILWHGVVLNGWVVIILNFVHLNICAST